MLLLGIQLQLPLVVAIVVVAASAAATDGRRNWKEGNPTRVSCETETESRG